MSFLFCESLYLLVHLLDALDKSTELIARYATWSAHTFLRVNMTAQRSRSGEASIKASQPTW